MQLLQLPSHIAPRSQDPNKNVFSSHLNHWKVMPACCRSATYN